MLRNSRKYFALLGALVMCLSLKGQFTQSSYSIIGVGDINLGAVTQSSSMGGVGLSFNSPYYVNPLNPALLGMNESAIFHIGGSMDFRTYTNATSSYQSSTGGFKDFAVSLPIAFRKWNLGFGLTPISGVKYSYASTAPGPEGTQIISEFSGEGGLDEFYVSNGFKLGNLYLGAKVGIVFGSIRNEVVSFLDGTVNAAFGSTVIVDRRSFSDVRFQLGAAYKLNLSKTSFLNFGGTLNKETDVSSKFLRLLDERGSGGSVFVRDTLQFDREKKLRLPGRIGFGISYEKYAKFNLGIDFHTQDWKNFRDLDDAPNTSLDRSYRIAVGGEIIPNSQNTRIFGLLSYRFGVHFEKTPYLVNGQDVNDFGVSFGTSLPLSAFWGLSTVNVGATIGRRGSVDNGLIRENYVKLNFGFSVQDVTWFTRQKFN